MVKYGNYKDNRNQCVQTKGCSKINRRTLPLDVTVLCLQSVGVFSQGILTHKHFLIRSHPLTSLIIAQEEDFYKITLLRNYFSQENRTQIHSWNQPVLCKEGQVVGTSKQLESLIGLELTPVNFFVLDMCKQ